MLLAPGPRLGCRCPRTCASRSCAFGLPDCNKSTLTGAPIQWQRLPQRVRAQAFLDRVFGREERHAPELVKLDAEDEGGLGQTSAELFGPLASCSWLQQSDQ